MGKIQKFEQVAYLYIKNKILVEDWKRDFHIIESTISEDLNMSRSPVRSALAVLESEGIVEMKPYRGYFVTEKPDNVNIIGHKLHYLKIGSYRLFDRINKNNEDPEPYTTKLHNILQKLKTIEAEKDNNAFINTAAEFFETTLTVSRQSFLAADLKIILSDILNYIKTNDTNICFNEIQRTLVTYFEDLYYLIKSANFSNYNVFIDLFTHRLLQFLNEEDKKAFLEHDCYTKQQGSL